MIYCIEIVVQMVC